MELKEFILIFKKHIRLFLYVTFGAVLLATLLKLFIPAGQTATMILAVTRQGIQTTDQYSYDDYYRLLADEKFADTVAKWLGAPEIVRQILGESGYDNTRLKKVDDRKFFKAERISAQLVSVSYPAENFTEAKRISSIAVSALNQKTKELNQEQNNTHWFKVVADAPALEQRTMSWILVWAIALAVGMLAGFWAVLGVHYWQREDFHFAQE